MKYLNQIGFRSIPMSQTITISSNLNNQGLNFTMDSDNSRSFDLVRGEMPLEPRASWFSPKCVEAQQLTGHLGVKHCFGAGWETGTKSRQTQNTRWTHSQ